MMSLKIVCAIIFSLSLHTGMTDAAIQLQSYNYPDYYIAGPVRGGAATINRQAKPETWEIVSPSLCNVHGSVSFRIGSQNSNVYLQYKNGVVYAEAYDRSSAFANSACFYIRQDKWFPGHAAIESVKSPGHFFRHERLQLKLHPYSSTTLFEMDASYRILQTECKWLQSYNYAAHYFGLKGRDAYISSTAELWIPVRPGLAGHKGSVSFRSCYNARKYLRHSCTVITLKIHSNLSWILRLVSVNGSILKLLHMKALITETTLYVMEVGVYA